MGTRKDDAATAQTVPPLDPGALHALFAHSPDLVAVTDADGRLKYTNHPAAANGTRWSETLFDLVLPAARDAVRQAHQRVFETGAPASIEVPARTTDGRSGWMLLTSSPIRSGEHTVALLHRGADITERRAEEERLRRTESLMIDTEGVAHIGIWEWDITQPHATWSPGLYVIYGLNPKTYVPSYEEYLKRVHPDDRQRVMDATNAVFHQHQPYSHDERIFRADGTIRYLHSWAMPILAESGKLLRLMGVCQDITDRKQAENAVAEHAAELARSNVELEQFAYVASHDLQEPLRSVASFVQLLERRYKGRLDADADETIRFAVEGVKRMKALINDTLEYSRVRTGALTLTTFPLGEALGRALHGLKAAIDESGAVIRHGELPHVHAEQALIVSLFQNLLSNAIKFRGEAPPQIDIETSTVERGIVHVVLRDNGIGIPPAHRERIFDVFQRLGTDTPGTGIGLAICRKVVERHGGRIWVDGPPGPGTIVHFTLPARS